MSRRPGWFARIRSAISIPNIATGLKNLASGIETGAEKVAEAASVVTGAARGASRAVSTAQQELSSLPGDVGAAYRGGVAEGDFQALLNRNSGVILIVAVVVVAFLLVRK